MLCSSSKCGVKSLIKNIDRVKKIVKTDKYIYLYIYILLNIFLVIWTIKSAVHPLENGM